MEQIQHHPRIAVQRTRNKHESATRGEQRVASHVKRRVILIRIYRMHVSAAAHLPMEVDL
jgi:hypothetical protein